MLLRCCPPVGPTVPVMCWDYRDCVALLLVACFWAAVPTCIEINAAFIALRYFLKTISYSSIRCRVLSVYKEVLLSTLYFFTQIELQSELHDFFFVFKHAFNAANLLLRRVKVQFKSITTVLLQISAS